MISEREKLLREVMAADFSVIELNLYLNTHPYDQKALLLYKQCVENAEALKMQYQSMYGPLTPFNVQNTNFWEWIECPWPWE
mgnify:CR=1 FL=1